MIGSIIILDTVSLYNHLADDAIEEIHPVEIHTTNNRVSNQTDINEYESDMYVMMIK